MRDRLPALIYSQPLPNCLLIPPAPALGVIRPALIFCSTLPCLILCRAFPCSTLPCSRFVPPDLAQKYKLSLPDYGFGTNQIVVATSNIQRQSEVTVTGAAKDVDIKGGSEDLSAVFVTASSAEEAKTLAKGLLSGGLAACVNLIPQVSSMYMWEGKMEESSEVIMMIKVTMIHANMRLLSLCKYAREVVCSAYDMSIYARLQTAVTVVVS
jgi:uncharacterized protein involved in tolerance to divalent cations